jgi:hypothetical protein
LTTRAGGGRTAEGKRTSRRPIRLHHNPEASVSTDVSGRHSGNAWPGTATTTAVLLSRQRGPAMALLARGAGRQDGPSEGHQENHRPACPCRRFPSPEGRAADLAQAQHAVPTYDGAGRPLPSVPDPAEASTQAAPQPVGRYVAVLGDDRQPVADGRTRIHDRDRYHPRRPRAFARRPRRARREGPQRSSCAREEPPTRRSCRPMLAGPP